LKRLLLSSKEEGEEAKKELRGTRQVLVAMQEEEVKGWRARAKLLSLVGREKGREEEEKERRGRPLSAVREEEEGEEEEGEGRGREGGREGGGGRVRA